MSIHDYAFYGGQQIWHENCRTHDSRCMPVGKIMLFLVVEGVLLSQILSRTCITIDSPSYLSLGRPRGIVIPKGLRSSSSHELIACRDVTCLTGMWPDRFKGIFVLDRCARVLLCNPSFHNRVRERAVCIGPTKLCRTAITGANIAPN